MIEKTIIWEDRFEGESDSLRCFILKAESYYSYGGEAPLGIAFKLISNKDGKVVEGYNFDIRNKDTYKYSFDVINLLQGYCTGPAERQIINKLFILFISNSKIIQEIDPEYFTMVNNIKEKAEWI